VNRALPTSLSSAFGESISSPLSFYEVAPGDVAGGDRRTESLPQSKVLAATPLKFEEVYRTFFNHVRNWTCTMGAPPAEREDLVQDVFLIVHRRLPDFDGTNIAGWLYRITRHRVRDFRRLRWFQLCRRSGPAVELLASLARGPEIELESKQQKAMLSDLLSKLPEAQRAAFVLFEIDGYSGEEIARLKGVPICTVRGRIQKARTKLAADITRLGYRKRRTRR
jgi:RNA polymerase sigma-70 factor (ECF subfamily)